jgi:hypothetical protein
VQLGATVIVGREVLVVAVEPVEIGRAVLLEEPSIVVVVAEAVVLLELIVELLLLTNVPEATIVAGMLVKTSQPLPVQNRSRSSQAV